MSDLQLETSLKVQGGKDLLFVIKFDSHSSSQKFTKDISK